VVYLIDANQCIVRNQQGAPILSAAEALTQRWNTNPVLLQEDARNFVACVGTRFKAMRIHQVIWFQPQPSGPAPPPPPPPQESAQQTRRLNWRSNIDANHTEGGVAAQSQQVVAYLAEMFLKKTEDPKVNWPVQIGLTVEYYGCWLTDIKTSRIAFRPQLREMVLKLLKEELATQRIRFTESYREGQFHGGSDYSTDSGYETSGAWTFQFSSIAE
jgi:hypothetical protein